MIFHVRTCLTNEQSNYDEVQRTHDGLQPHSQLNTDASESVVVSSGGKGKECISITWKPNCRTKPRDTVLRPVLRFASCGVLSVWNWMISTFSVIGRDPWGAWFRDSSRTAPVVSSYSFVLGDRLIGVVQGVFKILPVLVSSILNDASYFSMPQRW